MRTALILLLLLALASIVGSLIPQTPNSPERVARFLLDHVVLGRFYLHAGFFDVFGSWWFALITVLLFTSLVLCLLPRTRASFRNLRQRPLHAREIDAFPQYAERSVAAEPAVAISASERLLRRRRFRVDRAGTRLAAEKGALREIGSLLFHWSFVLLLAGAVWGKGTGYVGRAAIVEGETFTDASANYDGNLRVGRFFDGNFSGAQIRLRDFEDSFRSTGQPMDFVSHVDLLNPDGSYARSADVRVNHPASFDGLRIYQYGYGWAPDVVVRAGPTVLWSGPVALSQPVPPSGVSQLALPWEGVVKLPSLEPQVGLKIELWPSLGGFLEFRRTGNPVPMPIADHPFLLFTAFEGPLTDPSPQGLDTAGMNRVGDGFMGIGQTRNVQAGGSILSISFPRLAQFSVLQIGHDAGVPVVLLAAILLLLGLLPALYTSRRKVWIRVEQEGAGTVLKVGGFALQRKTQFEEEFVRLVDELARTLGEPAEVNVVSR